MNMASNHTRRCRFPIRSLFVLVALLLNIRFMLFFFHGPEKPSVQSINLTILIWRWPFYRPLDLSGDVCADLYNIKGCQLTDDRGLYNHADVVVFHHVELNRESQEISTMARPPGQKWVWANLESPSNVHGVSRWNNIFNWTLSYREDSDIFVPYGKMVPRSSPNTYNLNKTGMAAWVVSHYKTTQERARFVHNLSSYLEVDIYGRANRRPLCPTCLLPKVSQYFFYLALENSLYRDYITEKLWQNSFQAGAVPVVLGPSRGNYEKFVPPDSFIHVSDFPSPRDLASFLLSMSPRRYRRFFRWRAQHEVKLYTDWRERFCAICDKYGDLPKSRIYADLEGWFNKK